jgi:hypothetical protein
MNSAVLGLLRSDMADLQEAWEAGRATAARGAGYELDPMHDATVYSALVVLGMHGLSELARVCRDSTASHDAADQARLGFRIGLYSDEVAIQ